MITQKILYLLWSAINCKSKKACPSCGIAAGKTVDRKYFFTRLIECNNCHLYYRHPLENTKRARKFYENIYFQDDGITTKLPNENQLQHWVSTNFSDSTKSLVPHLSVIRTIMPDIEGKRIIDYGASWGYALYQFKNAGMSIDGYEISSRRASFAQRLGIIVKDNESLLTKENDIFYSSHVLEHVPSIPHVINLAKNLLRPNGIFIAFCPNGSKTFRKKNPRAFHRLWGLVHPNFLNPEYFSHLFNDNPYYIQSSPYNNISIAKWSDQQIIDETDGDELMVIAKLNQKVN